MFWPVVFVAIVTGHAAPAAPQRDAPGVKYALLVGVTEYPSLAKERWLEGPANDVRLMADVLQRAPFSVPSTNITTLTTIDLENSKQRRPADAHPARANIQREFERLARVVGKGDQVVILMAGHGSQQPNIDDPTDEEPDGMDEIFLPSDIGKWDGGTGRVTNAIVDDEIRTWVTTIRSKGVFVWVIFDSCQSGTMARGTNAERDRRVLPGDLGVPDAAVRAVQSSGVTGSSPESVLGLPTTAGEIAALYASEMRETTPEKRLPGPGSPWHGLFTYTIATILQESRSPLTYRELAQRVIERYRSEGRMGPNPMFEGGGIDRMVLDTRVWPSRPDLVLGSRTEGGRWRLRAGAIHGLTVGTVLEMFPPAGAPDGEKVIAHVKVVSVEATTAIVESTAFGDAAAAPDRLTPGHRGRIAAYSLGVDQLRVGVQATRKTARGAMEYEVVGEGRGPANLERAVANLTKVSAGLVRRAQTEADAEWVLRIVNGEVALLPASGWNTPSQNSDSPDAPPMFRVARENDAQLGDMLARRLRHIVRVRNLLQLATAPGAADTDLDFRVDLVRYDGDNPVPVPMQSGGRTLQAGESIAFSIENRGKTPIDVTLLLLDDRYGIDPFYPPAESATAGRIDVNQTRTTSRFTVTASRVELDQLVSIAVRAANPPVSFAALRQPALDEIPRGAEQTPGNCGVTTAGRVRNALQDLLNAALCGGATTRSSLTTAQVNEHAMRLMAWRALPR